MEFETVPEGKDHNDAFKKACAIVEDRNKAIAKLFGVEPMEPKALFYHSTGELTKKVHGEEKEFKGYMDGSNEILLVHPDAVDGLFSDLWKEMSVITDYVLVKYYLCQIYFPNKEDFKLYYKYISDMLASVVSGKFQESVAKFEFKFYNRGKKLKKETAVGLLLYIMREQSGLDFIFENLDKIMEEQDIEKSVSEIYNKSIDELVLPFKEKTIQEERQKRELEKARKQQEFNEKQNKGTQEYRKKQVTRDKYKPNQPSQKPQQKEPSKYGYSTPKPN